MIDIHSHIIYGVDDGPATIKESIRMILEAEKLGVRAIAATPHFHEEIYSIRDVDVNFNEIKNRVKDCDIRLYRGFEVFLKERTPEDAAAKSNLSINSSRYLLFELPFDTVPEYTRDVLSRLNFNNYTPILAHPERNRNFLKNFNKFLNVVEAGCLVQVDAASITGVYGTDVKNFVRKLMKLDVVHCAASDAHCADDYKDWYIPAYKLVKQWAGENYADKLFNENPGVILDCGLNFERTRVV